MAARLERRPPVKLKRHDWLIRHAYNVTSQGGEDGVLAQVFRLLDEHEPTRSRRWCVEFGAWDGKHLSNTYALLHDQPERWSGVLIEADARRVAEMEALYRDHPNVTCVNSFVELEGPNRLDTLLARARPELPVDVDLMSIDVDGADYHIWDGLEAYTPKVVVIEFNPTIPNNVLYVQARSTNIYHGSSLAALIELGKRKGYELVSTTTFNGIFVHKSLYGLFQMEDNHIDFMHDVPMPTEFFQLYDGTIKLTGCKKLIWKKRPVHDEDLQILPAAERAFPFLPSEHDAMTAAAEHLEAALRDSNEDYVYFVDLARASLGKYNDSDIRKLLGYARQVCKSQETTDQAMAVIWSLCFDLYSKDFNANKFAGAIAWLKELLRVNPRCSPADRAMVLRKLGECFARERSYEDAEYHLQTALAIEPQSRETLKSLAKLYTKLKDATMTEEMVAQLRQLQVQQ